MGIPEELHTRAMRLYSARTGAFDTVVLEMEFDNLQHYEKCWEAIENYNASPERSAPVQRLVEPMNFGT